jgi:DNA-binding protein YbaB
MDEKVEIKISDIDWNKLTIEDFNKVESDLQQKHRLIKALQPKGKRNSGLILLKIRGKIYQVKEITVARLKSMKSEKSKEKLIDEIISSHNPIETL